MKDKYPWTLEQGRIHFPLNQPFIFAFLTYSFMVVDVAHYQLFITNKLLG
jgi:hypothetical protein